MKLKELLVQELPKRGGWKPEWEKACAVDGLVAFLESGIWMPQGCICYRGSDQVTREQYEAALAASQKVEWDGVGLPSVGSKVEALTQGEWVEVVVAYTEAPEIIGVEQKWREALVFDSKTTRPFWADELRPIRSESDKKRDEVTKAIASTLFKDGDFDTKESLRLATFVYGALSRNEIPHIHIE